MKNLSFNIFVLIYISHYHMQIHFDEKKVG